ncbi:MAG: sulfur carrier protein ThiS [Actinomycetota bacterium]|nr:sulfur carrier protein ThiS [Actinomycetota bacterium]
MQIVLNGRVTSVDESITLGGLIDTFTSDRRGIAVALNGEVITRSSWDNHQIKDDDAVEVLSIAAGG